MNKRMNRKPTRCTANAVGRFSVGLAALSLHGLAVAVAVAVAQAPAPPRPPVPLPVRITVNGEPVAFEGTGPMIQNDVVLVPLRGVFEKLGAQVRYEAGSRRIVARKGQKTINLTVGSSVALMNNTYEKLGVPAQIVGTATLVPLRFVSQSLGAQVNWQRGADTIALTTDATVAEKLPVVAAGTEPLTGTLTGVFPELQSITVRGRDGQNRRVPLSRTYTVRQGTEGAGLNDLVPGRQVTVQRSSDGRATIIQVLMNQRSGTVKRFDILPGGSTRLLLTNGTSVELQRGLPVRMNGAVVSIEDIKPGEAVVVRVDSHTGLGIGLAVVTASDPNPVPPAPPEPDTPDPAPPPAPRDAPVSVKISTQQPPAPTPPADPAAMPAIAEVSHDGKDRALKGGDTVALTVKGTPKATVGVSVPALFETTNIPLAEKEDEPGTYQGTLTVPFNLTADAQVTAVLTLGEAPPVSRDFADRLDVDSKGPEITPVTPRPDVTVREARPAIIISYADVSKVNSKSVRLLLDDKDVTDELTITPTGLTYTPKADLPAGRIALTVSVSDERGNAAQREWVFLVKPIIPTLVRVSAAPTGTLLRRGAQITVRAEGAPGSVARFQLGRLAEGEMHEESPGVYVGTYQVKKGDSLPKSAATVIITPQTDGKKGEPVIRETSDLITVSAAPLLAPIIESPTATQRVRKEYTVFSGRAEPFSKVRLSLSYEGKAGFSKRGEKLFETEVPVNEEGRWKTELFALTVPKDVAGVVYTVSAVTVVEDVDLSPVAVVRFKK